jgi:hypothetical protein
MKSEKAPPTGTIATVIKGYLKLTQFIEDSMVESKTLQEIEMGLCPLNLGVAPEGWTLHPLRSGYDVKGVLHFKYDFKSHLSELE